MEYPFVSTTNAGDNLLASTNGDPNNNLVLDKAVFSNQPNNSNEPLEDTTKGDFVSPIFYKIQAVKHNENTMQPEVTLDNKNFKQDYPVYMIGVLGHAQNDTSGNETLCAIAVASNDPLIMPKATDNDYKCTFALPIGIDNSKDVKIVATDAGTVSYQDFANYQSSVNSSLSSNSASASTNSYNISLLSSSVSYNSSEINNDESLMASNYNLALKASGQASDNADNITTLQSSLNSLSNVSNVASGAYALADQANSVALSIPRTQASSSDPSLSATLNDTQSRAYSAMNLANANSADISSMNTKLTTASSAANHANTAVDNQGVKVSYCNSNVETLESNVNDNSQNISTIQQNMGNIFQIHDLSKVTATNQTVYLPAGIYYGIPDKTIYNSLPNDNYFKMSLPICLLILPEVHALQSFVQMALTFNAADGNLYVTGQFQIGLDVDVSWYQVGNSDQ